MEKLFLGLTFQVKTDLSESCQNYL